MIDTLESLFDRAHGLLFEHVVLPALYAAGGGSLVDDAYSATGWLLVGLLQLVVMGAVLAPLERWRPVERWRDRAAVRVDVVYTLLHRLGIFRVAMFFAVEPMWNDVWGWLAVHGFSGLQLDQALGRLWPSVAGSAAASFLLYLAIFDLALYLIHRAQHRWDWWWSLHALHHSQRQMTMWTDSRNHLLDSVLTDVLIVQLGHAIGVPPGQFVALVAVSQLMENLSHANVRLSFGAIGERLFVSPRFHRMHHAMEDARATGGPVVLGGCNFSVLFPLWDIVWETARFDPQFGPTGVRDQLPEEGGVDYGQGFWSQQWRGVERLVGSLRR